MADNAADESPAQLARAGKLTCLKGFHVTEILRDDPAARVLALLGTFQGDDSSQAVVVLAQKPLDKNRLTELFEGSSAEQDFVNDVYSKYALEPAAGLLALTLDTVYPATEKHISKWKTQTYHIVHETPELYMRVTQPHIAAIPPARTTWVYNMLDKIKEAERLLFEDPDPELGFMMHPDMKWDQRDASGLYCLAMVVRRDLRSVRDLRAEHVPLLKNVRDKGAQALKERYGTAPDQLRIFLHYQPSYYHLHVHFVALAASAASAAAGSFVGKALLLDDVIDNIETFGSDFYARKTLTYVLGEQDELWARLQQAGREGKTASDL